MTLILSHKAFNPNLSSTLSYWNVLALKLFILHITRHYLLKVVRLNMRF
nr:MAG TPA: hypothetical protein [Bacteriophage sp.]